MKGVLVVGVLRVEPNPSSAGSPQHLHHDRQELSAKPAPDVLRDETEVRNLEVTAARHVDGSDTHCLVTNLSDPALHARSLKLLSPTLV